MRDLVRFIVWIVADLFRSRAALEAEILTLRQQIIVLRRTAPKKQTFGAIDRLVFVGLYRLFPRVLDAVPAENQIRIYSWCNPPRIGRQRIRPALFTVRDRGAS